ncbi:hypothetical protein BH10PLA2_BH10PLA2_37110 [soil metagenome]
MSASQEEITDVHRRFKELSDGGSLLASHPVEILGRSEGMNTVLPDVPESQLVYFGGEGWMRENRQHVVDWLGEVLELRHTDGWKRQRKAFLRLMCQIYEEESPRPAWLVVQTRRVKIRQRMEGSGYLAKVPGKPEQRLPDWFCRNKPCIEAFHLRLPIRDLRFAAPGRAEGPDLVLTKIGIERQFNDTFGIGRGPSQFFWERQVWWTATHLDDAPALKDLRSGIIPASSHLYQAESGVVDALLVSWVKVWPKGTLLRCAFELDPVSGETLSFRAVDQIALGMSFRMDREEKRLVQAATGMC